MINTNILNRLQDPFQRKFAKYFKRLKWSLNHFSIKLLRGKNVELGVHQEQGTVAEQILGSEVRKRAAPKSRIPRTRVCGKESESFSWHHKEELSLKVI